MCGIFTLLNNDNHIQQSIIESCFSNGKGRGPEFSSLSHCAIKAQLGFHRLAINGLNPDPGAWFEYKKIRYKIWKASIVEQEGSAGTIIDKNFTIACKDKSIKIIEIQREGKNKLLLKDFLLGMNYNVGDLII